jgi:hypothetical protein
MARTRPFQLRGDPSRPRPARAEENEQYRKFIENFKLRQAALVESNAAARRAAAAGSLVSNTQVAATAPHTKARATRLAAADAARTINAIANPKAFVSVKKVAIKKTAHKKPAAKTTNAASNRKDSTARKV